jgi:hypothetical protein
MAIKFHPDAAAALDAAHQSDPRLADRIEGWLDRLEADHTQRAVRTHRLARPPLWYIPVTAPSGADWVILWNLHEDDLIVVRYIGPASFA